MNVNSNDVFFSIVIPTYKRVDYLERLLLSIEKQTFHNYEIIVVDDASPNVEEYNQVVERFKGVFSSLRFFTKEKNCGAPNSRNIGMEQARYDWIAFVDDDDEWLPNKLENQAEILRNSATHLGMIYSWTDAINQSGETVYSYRETVDGFAYKEIIDRCFIPSPSVVVRKSALIKIGGFDEKMPSCQDWDTWTSLIFYGYAVKCSKHVDVIYHKHDGPTIGTSKKSKTGYRMYYRKHFFKLLIYRPYYILRWLKLEFNHLFGI